MAIVDYHGMNDKNFMGTQVLFSMKSLDTKNGIKGWNDDERVYPVGYAMLAVKENEDPEKLPVVIMKIGDGEHKFSELPMLNGEITPMSSFSFIASKIENNDGGYDIKLGAGENTVEMSIPGKITGEIIDSEDGKIYQIKSNGKELISLPATVAVLNNDIKNFIKNQMITIQDTTLVINTNLL